MALAGSPGSALRDLLLAMRPQQWIKNVFVFAALAFAGRLADPRSVVLALAAFAAFCALSGAVYIINDLADAPQDRLHPVKRNRPIAAGRIGRGAAGATAAAAMAAGLALCVCVGAPNLPLLAVGAAYVALHLVYTFWARGYMLVDVIAIALGFVLRAVAGGLAIDVPVSRWLLACTFALCMFLAFAKRRCEISQLGGHGNAAAHRTPLGGYSLPLLDQFLGVSAGVAIVSYLLYTMQPGISPLLLASTPLVVYCIFRIAALVVGGADDPTAAMLRDPAFLLAFGSWCCYSAAVVTWDAQIQGFLLGVWAGLGRGAP